MPNPSPLIYPDPHGPKPPLESKNSIAPSPLPPQPPFSGAQPSPRQQSAITYFQGKIFVHGGRSNLALQDLYVVDVTDKEWRDIECQGTLAPPR